MARLKVSFDSNGAFTRMINKRVAAWSGRPTVGATLHAPDSLAWWYWNEFGTATKATGPVKKHAAYKIRGTKGNPLVFWDWRYEGVIVKDYVSHPGITPSHSVLLSQPEYQRNIQEGFKEALSNGGLDNPTVIQQSILHSVQFAKEAIGDTMNITLQGNDTFHPEGAISGPGQGGKLKGQSAGDVFKEQAVVIPNGE